MDAPSYKIPFVYRNEVRDQIKEMLLYSIIEPCPTEFLSPLVTVCKKDKSVRLCLDTRFINNRMSKDFIIPPNPQDLLINLTESQCRVFSTIDLTAAYWQIPIARKCQEFLSFIFEGVSYIFVRTPFGLKTPMAALIRCLDKILGHLNYVLIYVDNLVVFSKDATEHMKLLKELFFILLEAEFTVKLRKSQLFRKEVSFLGDIICKDGIKMDESRVVAVCNSMIPRNQNALKWFLGMVNYDSRFCNNYSELTLPLLQLFKKGVI